MAISLDLSQSGDEFDISLFQSNGLDPLALQVKYWARHSKYKFSEDWVKDTYPNIKFDVTSKVTILHPETLKQLGRGHLPPSPAPSL